MVLNFSLKINILFIAATAAFSVEMLFGNLIPKTYILPDAPSMQAISNDINPQQTNQMIKTDKYDIRFEKNLFIAEIEETISEPNKGTEDTTPEKLEPTNLKLILKGTVVGISQACAVIEDKKAGHQSLYEVGDSIQDAKIKKILRCKVILAYQGKDQILEMEGKSANQVLEMKENITDQVLEMEKNNIDQVPEMEEHIPVLRMLARKTGLEKAPDSNSLIEILSDNINELMKQVRFRPHLKDGQRDGLMVYGIRPGSEFSQIGFKNGDILKDFNGIPIRSSEDILGLFYEMIKADKPRITLSRGGEIKEWAFQIDKNGELLKREKN